MALSIHRRHRKHCPQAADRISKKCRCPWWATGTLEGRPYRKTLKTANHERAEQLKHQIEAGNVPEPKSKSVTFEESSARFIRKLQAENRTPDTIRKYRLLFSELSKF